MSECEQLFVRVSELGHVICIGHNSEGIPENPEDVVNICFFDEKALELDEDGETAFLDHDAQIGKWSMTPDEAREIAEHLVKAAERADLGKGQAE